MAEVQVHLRPVDKKMNGPLARRNFFTSPVRCHYCKKSLAANPKSPQVHGPLGTPRNSKPLSAEGSALLLVPKDGDHTRGGAQRGAQPRRKKDPRTHGEYKRNDNKTNGLFSPPIFVDRHITNQVK